MSAATTSQNQFVAALVALLREKTYDQIRISDLCRQAALSRQTFYKFFSNKDALLEYLSEGLYLMYLSHRDYRQREGFFSFWLEQRELAEVLIDRGLMHRVARVQPQTIELLRPMLQWDAVTGRESMEKLVYEFVSAGEIRLLECWRADGWRQSPKELADVVELVIFGDPRMKQLTQGLRG